MVREGEPEVRVKEEVRSKVPGNERIKGLNPQPSPFPIPNFRNSRLIHQLVHPIRQFNRNRSIEVDICRYSVIVM
jgi:hypothetical protein